MRARCGRLISHLPSSLTDFTSVYITLFKLNLSSGRQEYYLEREMYRMFPLVRGRNTVDCASTGGGLPPVDLCISARTCRSMFSLLEFSHFTNSSINRNSRSRSCACSCSVGKSSGCSDGSSTREAKSTARQAARGRRAHHKCSVEGWPCRIDFSRAEAVLMATSGNATSISFLR